MPNRYPSLIDRFWNSVVKTDNKDDCWGWSGQKTKGYGRLSIGHTGWVMIHRLSWTIHNGEIPQGKMVLHKCDNPPCSNPCHLFIGTQKDNISDAARKGRLNTSRGEAHRHKLTTVQVLEIRRTFESGETKLSISKKFKTSRSNVQAIVNRITWTHI